MRHLFRNSRRGLHFNFFSLWKQAAHHELSQSKDLQNFLEASEDEFAMEVERANHESSGGNSAKKTLSATLQKLKDFGHQTQNLVQGKHVDEEEDPEYLKASTTLNSAQFNEPCRTWASR